MNGAWRNAWTLGISSQCQKVSTHLLGWSRLCLVFPEISCGLWCDMKGKPPRWPTLGHCAWSALYFIAIASHCISLSFTAFIEFHCISWHFIASRWILLRFIEFHCISWHFMAFHCISLRFIASHCISLRSWHLIALHCISLHFIAFHCLLCVFPCALADSARPRHRNAWTGQRGSSHSGEWGRFGARLSHKEIQGTLQDEVSEVALKYWVCCNAAKFLNTKVEFTGTFRRYNAQSAHGALCSSQKVASCYMPPYQTFIPGIYSGWELSRDLTIA